MYLCASIALLAQVPTGTMYVDPLKLAAIAVLFVLWVLFAQWVDKDTIAVNTYRELWNLVVLTLGVVGLILALFVPNFLIGFLLMAVLDLAAVVAYVMHRNGLVKPEDRVCTMAHFQRIQAEGLLGKAKKKSVEVTERVRLIGSDRKVVPIPEEENEREQFRLVQDLMWDMLWRRASVIEIIPSGQSSRITYQVDGVAVEREALSRPDGDATVRFFKTIADLNLEEHRKPQRGRMMAMVRESKYRIIVDTAGSTAGERLRLHVVGLEGLGRVADLGFTPKQLETLKTVMERPRGLVLISALPGNGLTTAVYSFTRSHDAFLQNIQTLEYDKEVEVDNVTQRVYAPADDKTFTAELHRLVRSDPDILVFPEIREKEAAKAISQSAAEKLRIYVGLQAEDVFDALRKWSALVGDRALLAKSLWAISSQRLIRKLCAACKQPYKPEPTMLKKLNMPPGAILHRPPEPQFDKRGHPVLCQACQGTGYVGRTGVFDLLVVDDELRKVLRTATSMSEVQAFALKRGGLGFQTPAIQKVLDGTTSIQEVVRVIRGQAVRANGGAAVEPTPQPRPQSKQPTRKPGA